MCLDLQYFPLNVLVFFYIFNLYVAHCNHKPDAPNFGAIYAYRKIKMNEVQKLLQKGGNDKEHRVGEMNLYILFHHKQNTWKRKHILL
jgi:hypothetical protein